MHTYLIDYYAQDIDIEIYTEPCSMTCDVADVQVHRGDDLVDVKFLYCLDDADAVMHLRYCVWKTANERLQRQIMEDDDARLTFHVDLRTFRYPLGDWTAHVTVKVWNADGTQVTDTFVVKDVALPECPYILAVGHSGPVAAAA